ncbi:kinesin, partial [Strigomonas culicis]
MCFGQTGSGKTFTMSGRTLGEAEVLAQQQEGDGAADVRLVSEDGLQYRAVRYMARRLREAQGVDGATVQLRASYMELYNETINDLLQGSSGLKCRWAAVSKQFFVEGLMLVECECEEDLLLVLREGQANRQRSCHMLNADSSRSHVLFTMYAETHRADGPTRYGKITFVDLAGSECLKDTGSDVRETRSINQSLFALGNVLERLSELQRLRLRGGADADMKDSTKKKKNAHVDYRSSVLTQLLMDSLDGNCRTLMVACATPSSRFVDESLRTIHYAQRTRSIAAAPAQRVNLEEKARQEQREELQRLRRENALLRRHLGLPSTGALTEAEVAAAAGRLAGTCATDARA